VKFNEAAELFLPHGVEESQHDDLQETIPCIISKHWFQDQF
jgi:hypothetical protein